MEVTDTDRLQWLAENMELIFGKGEYASWQLCSHLFYVHSDRETCRLDDLRESIDWAMQQSAP